MDSRVEVLLATMGRHDMGIAAQMNVQTPMVIANQCGAYGYEEDAARGLRMVSTATRGVGINRNIGLMHARGEILLFADDDMVYADGYEKLMLDAYEQLPDADVIIFSIDMIRGGKHLNTYLNRTRRISAAGALKYGTYCVSVRRRSLEKANLKFTALFGGGAIYSSGEDSLFLMDCFRAGFKVYTHSAVIGCNMCGESTWFRGYNEKYFYDKGAWLACAFGLMRRPVQLYFGLRFRGMTKVPFKKRMKLMSSGIRGFDRLLSYEQWRNSGGGGEAPPEQ